MQNIQRTKLYGGSYKNNIVLDYPCMDPGVQIEHVRGVEGDPPTLEDVANALARHRSECEYCSSTDPTRTNVGNDA